MILRRHILVVAGGLAALAGTGSGIAQEKQKGMTTATPSVATVQDKRALVITHSGSQPSRRAPAEHFTGYVRIDSPFQGSDPARLGGASVTFEPGARTAWHTHPLGQTLIVTSGRGWVQCEGGPKEEIGPGDVVWIPAGVKHWHGATATTAMTHIAIRESLGGKGVDWMEKVSDEQYQD
jgi:quercetin dioxygenase-like cupin family protein